MDAMGASHARPVRVFVLSRACAVMRSAIAARCRARSEAPSVPREMEAAGPPAPAGPLGEAEVEMEAAMASDAARVAAPGEEPSYMTAEFWAFLDEPPSPAGSLGEAEVEKAPPGSKCRGGSSLHAKGDPLKNRQFLMLPRGCDVSL